MLVNLKKKAKPGLRIKNFPHAMKFGAYLFIRNGGCFLLFSPARGTQVLSCSLDGKFLLMKKMLDLTYEFHILFAVEPLTGLCPFWADTLEFGFPESKHIRFQACQAADLSNSEIKLIRYV